MRHVVRRPSVAAAFLALLGALTLASGALAGIAMPQDSAPPANDSFAGRTPVTLTGNTATVSGTTVEATSESGEPNAGSSDKTVWYTWTATQGGMLTVGTCGTGAMHFANVYTGDTLPGLSPLTAASNPGCSGGQSGGLQGFVVQAGTQYRIQVVGYIGSSGPFNLTLTYSNQFPLTVNKTGSTGKGRVTSSPAGIDCGVQCSGPPAAGTNQSFAAGTSITLTAQPASPTSAAGDLERARLLRNDLHVHPERPEDRHGDLQPHRRAAERQLRGRHGALGIEHLAGRVERGRDHRAERAERREHVPERLVPLDGGLERAPGSGDLQPSRGLLRGEQRVQGRQPCDPRAGPAQHEPGVHRRDRDQDDPFGHRRHDVPHPGGRLSRAVRELHSWTCPSPTSSRSR